MLPIYFCIIYLITNTETLKTSSVGAKSVIKRDTDGSDLLPPDFLPFKKRNEDVGELKQVPKAKVKKRLAPPMNFLLRAVEPEGDDYYDKGQGDSDSDDYYEKKEWSDLSRLTDSEDKEKVSPLNHTEISEIDGVVNIIVGKPSPVLKVLKQPKELVKSYEKATKETKDIIKSKPAPNKKKSRKYEEDDYEESDSEKRKPGSVEYDQSENKSKKLALLDSVDDLKERHVQEQKLINEKLKEEEMNIEEHERNKIQSNINSAEHDKYDDARRSKNKNHVTDYDEYEDKSESTEEKVVVTPARTRPTTTLSPIRTNKRKGKKEKYVESGKLSVFKNPQLFVVYDEDLEEATPKPTTKPIKSRNGKKMKFSSTYTTTPANTDENERISLLPAEIDGKNGEPTLFFPRKRKNKKRNRSRTTSKPTDSIVAETVAANHTNPVATATAINTATVAVDTSAANTIVSDTTAITGSAATEPVTDVVAASTDHKAEKKHEDYHRETGGMKDYHSSHEEEHSEEGKKAYEVTNPPTKKPHKKRKKTPKSKPWYYFYIDGVHKESKTAKGHHEKEGHSGNYHDDGGMDKHHEEESEHYGVHSHEEHGKKHAKYEESGKHSKGHNTKGSHDIHKKEEYEKKVEFFEEEGDSSEEEKSGGYQQEKGHSEGSKFKKAGFKAGHEEHAKGESGFDGHGGLVHVSKGHKLAEGHDTHGKHEKAQGSKGGKGSGKKWIYHHGYPGKTSNLVRIDRRAEKYFHGPQYYG